MSSVSTGESTMDFGIDVQQGFTARITRATAMIQSIGGVTAIVSAIFGLVGLFPPCMAGIATVVVAAALALQALAAGRCYSHLVRQADNRHRVTDVRIGLTAEFITGSIGVVLGTLALLGLGASTPTAIAVLVMGTGLLLGAGLHQRLAQFAEQSYQTDPLLQRLSSEVVAAAAGAEVMAGAGAIVLGIIALIGPGSLTLVLVGLLALGGSTLMTGAAMVGRMGSIWAQ